jgi:hypothetical protein
MEVLHETKPYTDSRDCKHKGEKYRLANGEVACEKCIHVCLRADGTVPEYPRGKNHDAFVEEEAHAEGA